MSKVVIALLFLQFVVSTTFSTAQTDKIQPSNSELGISSSFDRQDIFIHVFYKRTFIERLNIRLYQGYGVRKTFYQKVPYPKSSLEISWNLMPNEKLVLAPAYRFNVSTIDLRSFNSTRLWYLGNEIGVQFQYGQKIKVGLDTFYGFTSFWGSADRSQHSVFQSFHGALNLTYAIN